MREEKGEEGEETRERQSELWNEGISRAGGSLKMKKKSKDCR